MDFIKRFFRKQNSDNSENKENITYTTSTLSKEELDKLKVGDIITLGNPIISETESELKWIEADENPFKTRILDCREFATKMVSTTSNQEILTKFLETRNSDGTEYIGKFPNNGSKCEVELNFNTKGKQIPDGVVFKASKMEEKWDIYKYANFLFFVRSWTGELMYFTNYIPSNFGFKVDLVVLDETKINPNNPFFEFKVVEFLIYSHILGLQVPHPIAIDIENSPEKIAQYSFSMFGNRGFFASYD